MASGTKIAVVETNHGTFKLELDLARAPRTAGEFVARASTGAYDRNSFHRVAANFVIQGGAVRGAEHVPWEGTGLKNTRYSIAMARSGSANDAMSKDTATSQFFINLRDNALLDRFTYPYVVFGRVIEGQSVVDVIGELHPGNPDYDGPPATIATIVRVSIQA